MNDIQDRSTEPKPGAPGNSELHANTLVAERSAHSDADPVYRTLDSILRSAQFRSSRQCQDLLQYVIEQSLNDQNDLLRERVIGAAVFCRPPDYDTANDPIVRARMAEVRKRLAQYYQSVELDPSLIHIEIPPGHYRALFHTVDTRGKKAAEATMPEVSWTPAVPAVQAPIVEKQEPIEAPPQVIVARRHRSWWVLLAACLLVIGAVAVTVRMLYPPKEAAFDQFWAPVLNSPMPVILYTGTNVVYRFSPEFLQQYRETYHLPKNGAEFSVDLASLGSLKASDMQVSTTSYITTDDMRASTAITSMLVRHKKLYELRFGQDLTPGDLHSAPVILLGAFNNSWTLNVTDPLRFRFYGGDTIKDAADPKRSWKVNAKPDGVTTDDYAIISRLRNTDRGQTIMTAAGIGEYGTQAASEFLSSPEEINAFVRTAPAGWSTKNLQIVLHVKVVDDVPASQEIVAFYVW